jgi:two-component system sensor histidine kinase KdpD
VLRAVLVGGVSLALATAAAAILEAPPVGIDDASLVYLVSVVATAALCGTWPAMGTAFGALVIYDFLFIEPRYTLTIDDPREWLELLLFLFIAAVIGRLTAQQTERANEATRRAHESQALFAISRMLATTPGLDEAAPAIVERLARDAGMERIWIGLERPGRERIVADSEPGAPLPSASAVWSLTRTAGEQPAQWLRIHLGHPPNESRPPGGALIPFRVLIESEGRVLGHLWAARRRSAGLPAREHTRLLALAADQIALALRREQLAREATEAEIARRSEALKSALLDSVSHDLRTPLASIRAAAGGMADPAVPWHAEASRATGLAIEAETERLSRLVTNLLDASRIETGAIRPDIEPYPLPDLVAPLVERLSASLDGRHVQVELEPDLPPVRVDPILFEQVLMNLLENAIRHTPRDAPIRVAAHSRDGDRVELSVEDGGPGVPPAALPRLFDRFFRAPRPGEGARRGLGLGLSVVRGLVEAMDGDARAASSELGGLAVHVSLPASPQPPPEAEGR